MKEVEMVGMEEKMMENLMEIKMDKMEEMDNLGMMGLMGMEMMDNLEGVENMVCMDKKMILKELMVVMFVRYNL
jgi:hypothetical protein